MAKNTSMAGAQDKLPLVLLGGFALALVLLGIGAFLAFSGSSPAIGGGCVKEIGVKGEIAVEDVPAGLFGGGVGGSESIASEIRDADARGDVKAILVLIDSPGGSPVASRQIWSALKNSSKPTVAYMREMAASGGYYVAAGTDYIVAEPGTITGSIGVRATFSDLSGLFGKIGYNETMFKSGQFKDIGNPAREMTDEEKAIMQGIVDEMFGEFRGIVMEGRKGRINNARLGEIFDARVMTGRQALSYGLVDGLGDKEAAVEKAAQLAGNEKLGLCDSAGKKKGIISTLVGEYALVPYFGQIIPRWNLQY